MADIIALGPHDRMTVEECLSLCTRDRGDFEDVMVIGYRPDGELVVRSSHMSRKDAAWMLMAALDHARGKT